MNKVDRVLRILHSSLNRVESVIVFIKYCAALIFVLIAVFSSASFAEKWHKHRDVDFFTETYGVIDAVDLANVYGIFDRLVAVSNINYRYSPELIIINDKKNPSALVLDSGHIILSIRTLELLYKDVAASVGDTRLAFVIGHELAHLAADNFWSSHSAWALYEGGGTLSHSKKMDAKSISNNQIDSNKIANQLEQAEKHKQEIHADQQGFLFASLAGFPVDTLLTDAENGNDFFNYWASQTRSEKSVFYPEANLRTEFLIKQLQESLPKLEYFKYGVRLASFGRYKEAILFFREFQKVYPHREVFLNLGFSYLQMAYDAMNRAAVPVYWLPPVADAYTPFSELAARAQSNLFDNKRGVSENINKDAIQRNLKRSIVYLEKSIEKDPNYTAGHYNLALAWYYLNELSVVDDGKLLNALQAVEKALQRSPDNNNLCVLKAAIIKKLYPRSDVKDALMLQTKKQFPVEDISVLSAYNMALLYAEQPEESKKYWHKVTRNSAKLPNVVLKNICSYSTYYVFPEALCSKDNLTPKHVKKLQGEKAKIKAPVPNLPVEMWRDLLDEPFTQEELEKFQWDITEVAQFTVYENERYSILSIDDIVSFAIIKSKGLRELDNVLCCVEPNYTLEAANGELLVFDNIIAFKTGSEISELWVNQ